MQTNENDRYLEFCKLAVAMTRLAAWVNEEMAELAANANPLPATPDGLTMADAVLDALGLLLCAVDALARYSPQLLGDALAAYEMRNAHRTPPSGCAHSTVLGLIVAGRIDGEWPAASAVPGESVLASRDQRRARPLDGAGLVSAINELNMPAPQTTQAIVLELAEHVAEAASRCCAMAASAASRGDLQDSLALMERAHNLASLLAEVAHHGGVRQKVAYGARSVGPYPSMAFSRCAAAANSYGTKGFGGPPTTRDLRDDMTSALYGAIRAADADLLLYLSQRRAEGGE